MSDTAFAKLKRLKINRYRNIQPGTELRFADGINVLLGKNGSGKTTLLNLLAMVVSGNFHPIRREEFALEFDWEFVGRADKCAVSIANTKEPITNEETRERENLRLTFKIVFSQGANDEVCQITFDSNRTNISVLNASNPAQDIPFSHDLGPFNEHGTNFIENHSHENSTNSLFPILPMFIQRLDEARDWLHARFSSTEYYLAFRLLEHRAGHIVLQNKEQIFPYDFLAQLRKTFDRDANFLELHATDIQTLLLIVNKLGYTDGQVVFERRSKERNKVTFENPRFHFTMRDGTSIRLQDLSFGEQRLFAYYYYLACSPQVVIADELTNGMHHEMVRGCIQAIGQRQAFLATQNPLLLDHLEFASIDAARESFTLCSKELHDGTERMTFRQMSEDEGREFFGHYGAEQQHVNEILRCLGLW